MTQIYKHLTMGPRPEFSSSSSSTNIDGGLEIASENLAIGSQEKQQQTLAQIQIQQQQQIDLKKSTTTTATANSFQNNPLLKTFDEEVVPFYYSDRVRRMEESNKLNSQISVGPLVVASSDSDGRNNQDVTAAATDDQIKWKQSQKQVVSTATAGPTPQHQPQPSLPQLRRACRAPLSRKFGHPCTCNQLASNPHKSFQFNNVGGPTNNHSANARHNSSSPGAFLPPPAYTSPLYLYDPVSKRCLPTSRAFDMLLKECHTYSNNNNNNNNNNHNISNNIRSPLPSSSSSAPGPLAIKHGLHFTSSSGRGAGNCFYDDLVCDPRRLRCVCKPTFHLYYDANFETPTFACVPIGSSGANCRPGYIYNVISNECQKMFDVNELPPNYPAGVSATQFSFVTIVLIWILLLIFSIVATKLGKLKTYNLYRNSPSTINRGANGDHAGSNRHQHQGSSGRRGTLSASAPGTAAPPSAWLQPFSPFMTHQQRYEHRLMINNDRRRHDSASRALRLDETDNGEHLCDDDNLASGNGFNNYTRRPYLANYHLAGHLTSSELSLNNPPPKFEEIYPNCTSGGVSSEQRYQEQPSIISNYNRSNENISVPMTHLLSNEDLPTYEEAMKLVKAQPLPPDPQV